MSGSLRKQGIPVIVNHHGDFPGKSPGIHSKPTCKISNLSVPADDVTNDRSLVRSCHRRTALLCGKGPRIDEGCPGIPFRDFLPKFLPGLYGTGSQFLHVHAIKNRIVRFRPVLA